MEGRYPPVNHQAPHQMTARWRRGENQIEAHEVQLAVLLESALWWQLPPIPAFSIFLLLVEFSFVLHSLIGVPDRSLPGAHHIDQIIVAMIENSPGAADRLDSDAHSHRSVLPRQITV